MRDYLKIVSFSTGSRLWDRKSVRQIRNRLILTTLFSILAILCTNLLACQSQQEPPDRHYELRGTVVSVDPQQQVVVISHDKIVGYMEAMTMPFTLKQKWAYNTLAPGDHIQATLVVSDDRSWLEDLVITKKNEATEANSPQLFTELGAKPGDDLPGFALVNQDAHPIHLNQYQGQALVLTFIYTRCPLPDFCPKITKNFAEIYQALQQKPELYQQTRLLSISFDFIFDTPEVLRAYGAAFAGTNTAELFTHWEFATGTAQEVRAVTTFFGLVSLPETGQITHSLRTAVVTPRGKVFKIYTDNLWTPADILRDIEHVLERHP